MTQSITPDPSVTESPTVEDNQALATQDEAPKAPTNISEEDYEAIAAAVMETERGRWFLDEYAKRNRNSDTQTVLTAIDRLEQRIDTELGDIKGTKNESTTTVLVSRDLLDLAEAITQMKREVQQLGKQGDKDDHFDSATIELEAIVEQTEKATSEILEAAEKIQEVIWVLREEGANETQCDIIESKIIDVYTACSFQDLTGQRSNKVVRLVSYVERRVASMMEILGLIEPGEKTSSSRNANAAPDDDLQAYHEHDDRPDVHLLNGPAQEGDANEQGDVDAMFDAIGGSDSDTAHADEFDTGFDGIETDASDELDGGFDSIKPQDDSDACLEGDALTAAAQEDTEIDPDMAIRFEDVAHAEVSANQAIESQTAEASVDDPSPAQSEDISSGILGDAAIVEIHDAEILDKPADNSLMESALSTFAGQDLFEVDSLDFDGPEIGGASSLSPDVDLLNEHQPSFGGSGIIISNGDDFAVDDGVADMFLADDENLTSNTGDEGNVAQAATASDEAADDNGDLAQDVFDASVDLQEDVSDIAVGEELDLIEAEDASIIANQDDALSVDDELPQPADKAPTADDTVAEHAATDEAQDADLAEQEDAFDQALLDAETESNSLADDETTDSEPAKQEQVAPPKSGLLADYTDQERIALFS